MLSTDILKLPLEERVRLVEEIWDSIAEVPEALALSDEEKLELDHLLEAYSKNPEAGSPWAEVRKRIHRK